MDGTLVETEQLWGEAMFELAGQLGGRMSDEARAATVGTSMRSRWRSCTPTSAWSAPRTQLQADAAWVEDRTAELMAGGVSGGPGRRSCSAASARPAWHRTGDDDAAARWPTSCSASIRGGLGEDPFDVTVCGDEVPARKPDPAPYLQAMAALGVEPGECVVIEDSQAGITAGLAAGAAVLGVPAVQAVRAGARAHPARRPGRRRPGRAGRRAGGPALADAPA